MPSKEIKLQLRALKPGDSVAGLFVGDNEFQPLIDFFGQDAHLFEGNSLARTYVMAPRRGRLISAYLTLVCGEIKLTGVDGLLGSGLTYPYKTCPALKLARLLVDGNLRGRGIGKFLVDFTIGIAKNRICPAAGCRFVVVDAKQSSIGFYKGRGFTMIDTPQNLMRTHPVMFIDLHKTARADAA